MTTSKTNGWNNWGALKWAPLVLLLAGLTGCPKGTDAPKQPEDGEKAPKKAQTIKDVGKEAAQKKPAAAARKTERKKPSTQARKKSLRLPPALLESLMEQAAETGNRKAILELTTQYRANPDPKARLEFVEALFAIDRQGISFLAGFVSDKDPEVANRASSILETQLDIVEDDFLRSTLLGEVIQSVTDEDQLKVFCSKLSALPPHYAVRNIVSIVEQEKTNPAAAAAAKAEYETITGEKFISVKQANRWARMAER